MEAKAKAQLAALVLNIMSLKVAQTEVVTADGKTASDVLTYASEFDRGYHSGARLLRRFTPPPP